MFIGHFAVGLAGKKAAWQPSLGTFFLAVSWLDLLWPIFLLLGIEHVQIDPGNTKFTPLSFTHYPYTHSLLMALVWSVLFSSVYYFRRKHLVSTALLGIGVFSHWVLDFITHRPDLPLTPWSETRVGLGLWNSVVSTMLIEGVLFLLGVYLYSLATKPKDAVGRWSYWSLIVFMIVVYFGHAQGEAPPDTNFLAWFAMALWLFVPWGYWIDKHRERRGD